MLKDLATGAVAKLVTTGAVIPTPDGLGATFSQVVFQSMDGTLTTSWGRLRVNKNSFIELHGAQLWGGGNVGWFADECHPRRDRLKLQRIALQRFLRHGRADALQVCSTCHVAAGACELRELIGRPEAETSQRGRRRARGCSSFPPATAHAIP